MDLNRAMGIIVMGDGSDLSGRILVTADRTAIELAPDFLVGNIVRDPQSGRWRYDEQLVQALGIDGNPQFDTDVQGRSRIEKPLAAARSSHGFRSSALVVALGWLMAPAAPARGACGVGGLFQ